MIYMTLRNFAIIHTHRDTLVLSITQMHTYLRESSCKIGSMTPSYELISVYKVLQVINTGGVGKWIDKERDYVKI